MHRRALFLLIFTFLSFLSQAQPGFNPYQPDRETRIKRSPIRLFLNKFSVLGSIGYGRTFYKTEWDGVNILEQNNRATLLENYSINGSDISYTGITDWTFSPVSIDTTVVFDESTNIIYADSVSPVYKGSGRNIPFNVSVQLDIYRFRIGAGYSYELHKLKRLKPGEGGTQIYTPVMMNTNIKKWYFYFGGLVYHWKGWDYYGEIRVGKATYGPRYDKSVLSNGLFFDFGVPIEYEFSEYFWFFVRPSFEYKNYTLAMPLQYQDSNIPPEVTYKQPTLNVSFGFRYKFPEIRRCPVKSCRIQLKHVHSGREYRGQPFYKEQNPKIGELEHWRHKLDWLK